MGKKSLSSHVLAANGVRSFKFEHFHAGPGFHDAQPQKWQLAAIPYSQRRVILGNSNRLTEIAPMKMRPGQQDRCRKVIEVFTGLARALPRLFRFPASGRILAYVGEGRAFHPCKAASCL